MIDGLEGDVGLLADFGNWKGPQKYDDLAQILPRAESCHTKCHFSAPGVMDQTRFCTLSRSGVVAGFKKGRTRSFTMALAMTSLKVCSLSAP